MSIALRQLLRRIPGAMPLRRMLCAGPLAGSIRRRRFVDAYEQNYWRGKESRSGRGSDLSQTEAVRAALLVLCRELGFRSMLDVPCGDFHWMRQVALDGIDYTGADIVPALVAENRRRHGGSGCRFVTLDLVAKAPPCADLVLCRDLLVHLPFRDAMRALRNIRRSGGPWLLTTTFPRQTANEELHGRDWRPLNLQLPPFDLPPPVTLIDECYTDEDGRYRDKSLGLWRTRDLPG